MVNMYNSTNVASFQMRRAASAMAENGQSRLQGNLTDPFIERLLRPAIRVLLLSARLRLNEAPSYLGPAWITLR